MKDGADKNMEGHTLPSEIVMDDVETGQTNSASPSSGRAGDVLRTAREAQGLTLADIGARTRIPLRHLEAIEASDYQSLPAPTYATGFARAYARVVGIDEVAIAQNVRAEVQRVGRAKPEYQPYEIADQTRVPSRGVAVVGLGVALAILILIGIWFGTDWLRPGVRQDADAPVVATAPAPAAPRPAVTRAVPPATGGQVTLTANDEVWLRVYDADDKTLYLGTMKPGERFDVPAAAKDPKINVGRPDKLTVTLNGSSAPPLGDGKRPIKDVKVSADAVRARIAAGAGANPTPAPTPAG